MSVSSGIAKFKMETVLKAGGTAVLAAWMFAAIPGLAQDERSGVARPDPVAIAVDPGDAPFTGSIQAAKPSAAVPVTDSASGIVYGPYIPYRPAGDSVESPAATFDPDASIVTAATAGQAERRLLNGPGAAAIQANVDAGIVTHVPSRPGEIAEGSLVKVKLREELSTLTTRPGTKFTAEVIEPVMRGGQVVVPAGSILEGRVTFVRGGKRIGGQAAIHLEPRTMTLPDGTQYALWARVIDTSSWENTKVDSEGTIMHSENTRRNVGVMALTTGGAMAAGAMIGGVPGALIGAGVGAGVSAVVWLKQDRQAQLPKNLGLVFSLTELMSITPASAAVAGGRVGSGGVE